MNIFIIPSCIKTLIGTINYEDRFQQTLKTFDTLRIQVPDSIIIFCDSSIGGLGDDKKSIIESKVNYYLDFSSDSTAMQINQMSLKSIGETYLLNHSILYAKNNLNLNQKGRMFKLGGRCEVLDSFTMNDYKNIEKKFIFKKRIPSWKDDETKNKFGCTHLLETRLYSWNLDMTDEYLSILSKNFELLNQGLDTEHSHFVNVPKDKLLEFETLNIGAWIAGYTSSYYIRD